MVFVTAYPSSSRSSPMYSNYVNTSVLPYPSKSHGSSIISTSQGTQKKKI